MDKHKMVQKALKGLDVTYASHNDDGVIDMAKVNGYSIVWHKYAYTAPDDPSVEVMTPYSRRGDNIEPYFPISKLRELVT